jgi:eukaryotic-like serine/threonine-protein kinase
MPDRALDLDLGGIFATSKIAPELPPEIFLRRSTMRLPEVAVAPAHVGLHAVEPELPQPGAVVGKYRLDRMIGMGGFGAVFRARHLALGNVVAIKLMRPSVVRSRPALVRLLAEEARFTARIDHPNVMRVHDVATSHELPYIVMEYVDGPDLSIMIRRRGALPHKMVVRVLRHVAAALSAGLAEQLIHRDVKPSNILLTRAGVTKLTDFGLARSSGRDEATGLRGVVGTAAYMAPEQARDPDGGDFRSDLYALGITGYHALTGGLPAAGHVGVPPPSRFVSTIPPALDALILAMIASAPDARPASYAELDAALRAVR